LPLWAQVALAARFARRVYPLFHTFWPDASEEFQIVYEAILIAESAAEVNGINPVAAKSSREKLALVSYTPMIKKPVLAIIAVADAALRAALTASDLGKQRKVARCVQAGFVASANVDEKLTNAIVAAMFADLETLKTGSREGWRDNTPMPASRFG